MQQNKFVDPNPYVFPFQEFEDLSNKQIQEKIESTKVEFDNIKTILYRINKKTALEDQVLNSVDPNSSTAQKIFQLFTYPEIRFGDLEMYNQNKTLWIKKFNTSIDNNQFTFSILGFPFKVANALKTERRLPDLGEVLAMNRLELIASLVEKLSGVPTTIYAVTEGAFAKFVGVSQKDADNYANTLEMLSKKLNFTHLKFLPLQKMESYPQNFGELFNKKVQKLEEQYNHKSPEITKKVSGAFPIILRIVSPNETDKNLLMDVYNFDIPEGLLPKKALKLRTYLKKSTAESTLQYFAYLELRDDLGFLDKELGQDYIPLTVSPKPNRLGIIPILSTVTVLPHHGVPVFNPSKNEFKIVYLIDLLRSNQKLSAVYLKDDLEGKPFYYLAE